MELGNVVEKMEKNVGFGLGEFEEQNLMDKLGILRKSSKTIVNRIGWWLSSLN